MGITTTIGTTSIGTATMGTVIPLGFGSSGKRARGKRSQTALALTVPVGVLLNPVVKVGCSDVATKKVKGPEPGAMRHHLGCVPKHLNHGTVEKQTRTTRAS